MTNEYFLIHKWIRNKYGLADCCENGCLKGPFQWALKRGKTHQKIKSNYKKLCVKCHHRYDRIHKTGKEHFNFGKKASLETRQKMSIVRKGRKKTKSHCNNISKALKGRKFTKEHRNNLSLARRKLIHMR